MESSTLHKLGSILYYIYTLRSESLDMESYSKCCDKIYEALLDIAPEYRPRKLNPDIKEFVEQTNRRLCNE